MSWKEFKDYAHQVSTAVALVLIVEFAQVATYKFAMGRPFTDNWSEYFFGLIMLTGVNVGGMGLLRATNPALAEARARGKAQVAPTVNVEGDANVTAERQAPNVTTERAIPQGVTRSRDPGIRAGLETIAERQRAQRAAADDDDPGII